jgi:hypothetical protein
VWIEESDQNTSYLFHNYQKGGQYKYQMLDELLHNNPFEMIRDQLSRETILPFVLDL